MIVLNRFQELKIVYVKNFLDFFDVKRIAPIIDAVHVLAFDQWTPEMGPKVAYLTSLLGLRKDEITEPIKILSMSRFV